MEGANSGEHVMDGGAAYELVMLSQAYGVLSRTGWESCLENVIVTFYLKC